MNKPHKHAQLMLQYAQDAAETDKPWLRWEVKEASTENWISLLGDTAFYEKSEYRRKPRTININGFEVPEPMREKPEENTTYFVVRLTGGVSENQWYDDDYDNMRFSEGLCHSTREAAELHAKALLSFTKKEETK